MDNIFNLRPGEIVDHCPSSPSASMARVQARVGVGSGTALAVTTGRGPAGAPAARFSHGGAGVSGTLSVAELRCILRTAESDPYHPRVMQAGKRRGGRDGQPADEMQKERSMLVGHHEVGHLKLLDRLFRVDGRVVWACSTR
jgi:hypothetical protein